MQPLDRQLGHRLAEAFAEALGRPAERIDPSVRPATDPKFGDYQSNAAMALARQAGTNPHKLAEQVAAAAKLDDLCDPPEVAGPGFINLRLRREFIGQAVAEMAGDERLGVEPASPRRTIVVDFSSPNVAKPMHVGHLRSTILGDTISCILRFLGHRVITDNHVGDWGTQFGKLILGYKEFGDQAALEADHLGEMERLYQKVNALCEADPGVADQARYELLNLQIHDATNHAIWANLTQWSRRDFQAVYHRLGVSFDLWRGESDYSAMLTDVVNELVQMGIAENSEGATVIFFPDDPELSKAAPMIIQKSDNAYLYATTDLATVKWRLTQLPVDLKCDVPDEIIYVTDGRQQLHFRQLFAAVEKWRDRGYSLGGRYVTLTHVWFGTIQGPDGKPFKTRTGETVRLTKLLDEAEQRAMKIVEQKNPDLPAEARAAVARAVGIGAVKYFDLSNNRVSDYRFDWNQMLALTGNTAPYLQYAYARIRSIFRKAGKRGTVPFFANGSEKGDSPQLAHEMELALAKHLVRYGEAIERVVEDYRPNLLCDYLYELADRFSGFYENCPVLKADGPTRAERLALCDLTARVMKHGLGLLGIEVLEQM